MLHELNYAVASHCIIYAACKEIYWFFGEIAEFMNYNSIEFSTLAFLVEFSSLAFLAEFSTDFIKQHSIH